MPPEERDARELRWYLGKCPIFDWYLTDSMNTSGFGGVLFFYFLEKRLWFVCLIRVRSGVDSSSEDINGGLKSHQPKQKRVRRSSR